MITTIIRYIGFSVVTLMGCVGTAQAALVNFEVTGNVVVVDASNIFNLSGGGTITASGVFDDSVLAAGGSGTIYFADPGNSISFNVGSKTYSDFDLVAEYMTLSSNVLTDLNYSSGDGEFDAYFTYFTGADGLYGEWDGASFTTSPVPVPAAVWLFGSGLLGLVGLARRRR
ncbi:MAG: hypothetical protein CMN57_05610 [Gammaproteobacteria bacterium]|nr:hypothetical protein [Gammaproteobacteria bacterium]